MMILKMLLQNDYITLSYVFRFNYFVLNSDLNNFIGTHMAYVSFCLLGDYWWISSPIPCTCANKHTITLSDNIKNNSGDIKSAISKDLFEIRSNHDYFYILTNNQSVAGYIFGTSYPNRIWEVYYNVY